MKDTKLKIVVICGPTGVGKTSVAIELAEKFNGEIIGADSMQIYKYMDIGTAKPTAEEQARISHHMIDIIDPDESFDAAKYAKMTHNCILDLVKREKVPFIVGGTGLYIKALVHGLSRARPADGQVIDRLKAEAKKNGSRSLHERLSRIDREAADKIHPNDLFRIVRALEIFEKTGQPFSSYSKAHQFKDEKYDALTICLYSDRALLYERIDKRVDEMIAQGFLDEVRDLLKKGYSKELKSMQSIGYRQMAQFVSGDLSWEEALETLKRDTRRYAKRQLTWFRADSEVQWVKKENPMEAAKIIQTFLN